MVRVPNKVLLKIFAATNRQPGPGLAAWFPYWTKLMAVCTHWRDLICGTPEFWQKISVGRNPLWLELCLQRSQRLLIQLSFWHPVVIEQTLKGLRPHWSRIENLAFRELDCAQFTGSQTWLTTPPLPQLQTLILNVRHKHHRGRDGNSEHDDTGAILMLQTGLLPRLKTLRLEGISLTGEPIAFSTLRVLELCEYNASRPLFTTVQFITLLNSCTSLERLRIMDNALRAVVSSPVGERDEALVAQLSPRLRMMTVQGHVEEISSLLSHVSVPAHVDLFLSTREETEEAAAAAAFNMLPPSRLRRNVGMLQAATRLKIDSCHENHKEIKVIATRGLGTGSSGRLELRVHTPSGKDMRGSQARRVYYKGILRAVSDMFPDARLNTLVCGGDLDAITESEWRDRLLAHYPTIRTLVVDDGEFGGDAVPFFRAMGTTVVQMRYGGIKPPCPDLEYLWIRNAEPTVKLMEEVKKCLSRRQYHDVAPLKRLRLELNPDYERPVEDVSGYVPLLKRAVPQFEFKVWRRDVDDEEMFSNTNEDLPF